MASLSYYHRKQYGYVAHRILWFSGCKVYSWSRFRVYGRTRALSSPRSASWATDKIDRIPHTIEVERESCTHHLHSMQTQTAAQDLPFAAESFVFKWYGRRRYVFKMVEPERFLPMWHPQWACEDHPSMSLNCKITSSRHMGGALDWNQYRYHPRSRPTEHLVHYE